MSLKDDLSTLTPRQRRYILFRIADVDPENAKKLVGMRAATYRTWLHNKKFVEVHKRRDEYAATCKEEAFKLLRRDNQLAAIMLEEKIIAKMRDEVDSGDYNLLRTNLAKEVYTKIMSELDVTPAVQVNTWQQRVTSILQGNTPPQLEEAEDGEFTETTTEQTSQPAESIVIEKAEQTTDQTKEADECQ